MARYVVEMAFKGTNFSGWQRQPNAGTIQGEVEKALSTIFDTEMRVVGCGRTDAGVHARQFFFHFDHKGRWPEHLIHRLDRLTPPDLSFYGLKEVTGKFHSRFKASSRQYRFHLARVQSPFYFEFQTHYPQLDQVDRELLNKCANILLDYNEFRPFCKTKSDTGTMLCDVMKSEWTFHENDYQYVIKANRFLRGMVRLIVGTSLRVAIGEIPFQEFEHSLIDQTFHPKRWSIEGAGLFLEKVGYDPPLLMT